VKILIKGVLIMATYKVPSSTAYGEVPYSFICEHCGKTNTKDARVATFQVMGTGDKTTARKNFAHITVMAGGKIPLAEIQAMEIKAVTGLREKAVKRQAAFKETGDYHRVKIKGRCLACKQHQSWERKGALRRALRLGIILGIAATALTYLFIVMFFAPTADLWETWMDFGFVSLPICVLIGLLWVVKIHMGTGRIKQKQLPDVQVDAMRVKVEKDNGTGRQGENNHEHRNHFGHACHLIVFCDLIISPYMSYFTIINISVRYRKNRKTINSWNTEIRYN